ncbi:fimbrial protein, partial [Burkholderia ubonensis]|uniref:fimbrial protein n=1 Tax=Burkholderia ubonensis TaxID=101571 RepID=UPI000B27CFC3
MKRFHLLLLGIVAVLNALPSDASASCRMLPTGGLWSTSTPFTFYIPAFNSKFDVNVPVGTIIATQRAGIYGVSGTVTCTGFGLNAGIGYVYYRGTTGEVGAYNAYPTSIPGIGVRISTSGNGIPSGWWPRIRDFQLQKTAGFAPDFTMVIDLVKTGPITKGGAITGKIAGMFAQGNTVEIVSIVVAGSIQVEPQGPTCEVATSSVLVPLGEVPVKTFTGIGSVSPARPFDIRLSCSGGGLGTSTDVYATLTLVITHYFPARASIRSGFRQDDACRA